MQNNFLVNQFFLQKNTDALMAYKTLKSIGDERTLVDIFLKCDDYTYRDYIVDLVKSEEILLYLGIKESSIEIRSKIYNLLKNRSYLKKLLKFEKTPEGIRVIQDRIANLPRSISFITED